MADSDREEVRAARRVAWRKHRTSWVMNASTALAMGAILSTVPALFSLANKRSWLDRPVSATFATSGDAENKLKSLQAEITRLKADFSNLNVVISDKGSSASTSVATANFERRMADIEKRQATLDRIILDNPQKALELPLLKRDVDTIKQSNEQSILSIKQSVDQVYDLNKWLLGSMAIGVLCLALSHFFRRKSD